MSLVIHDVAMSFGDQKLFSHVNFELHAADRVGLLGRNGSGKTTLLRLLEGSLSPSSGSIGRSSKLAYLPQLGQLPDLSLLEAIRPAHLTRAWQRFQHWQNRLTQPSDKALEHFGAAEESWRQLGGYDFEQRATETLDALGLHPDWTTAQLSGGQRRRALLAQLLLTPADSYLLDEPTNHLDWSSLEWLEEWVQNSPAAFLIVSHDRAFLDATVSRCVELERGQLREYAGNYSEAMELKATLRASQERQYQSYKRKTASLVAERRRIAQQAASTDRYNHKRKKPGNKMSAKNRAQDVARTLASRAQALQKRLARMTEPERILSEKNFVRLELNSGQHGPNEVLGIWQGSLERDGQTILAEINLQARRGEKIAVLGPNGSGKTTLLRAIVQQATPVSTAPIIWAGDWRLADMSLRWAGQNHEELAEFEQLADALLDADPQLGKQKMYQLLAQLGLPRQLEQPLSQLSGGQITRLALARLTAFRAQLLILDEPTNHLDYAAIEAVQQVLASFEGTLIFASHDRELVSQIATRYWWLEHGQVQDLGDSLEALGN